MEINKVYNQDCLIGMKEIPNESIDLIVTDPPYRTTSRGNGGNMGGYWQSEKTNKGVIFEYNNISCSEYLPEFYRVLKDKTILYLMTNNKNLIEILNVAISCGFNFVKSIIWDKCNKICGTYYMGCYEYILLFRKGGDKPINNCSTPDILRVPITKLKSRDGSNLHDTEKPVSLMQILIENSSDKGELVLDPFMGIGATAIACINSKRNYIGFEIDEKYYNFINKRIEKEQSQLRLF